MKNLIADKKLVRKKMIDLDIKSITELAVKSGISKPTIYDYLNGKSPLSTTFIRLCKYLEVSPSEILTEVEARGERKNV